MHLHQHIERLRSAHGHKHREGKVRGASQQNIWNYLELSSKMLYFSLITPVQLLINTNTWEYARINTQTVPSHCIKAHG